MTDSDRPSESADTPAPSNYREEQVTAPERSKGSSKRMFFNTKTASIDDIANEFWDKVIEPRDAEGGGNCQKIRRRQAASQQPSSGFLDLLFLARFL